MDKKEFNSIMQIWASMLILLILIILILSK